MDFVISISRYLLPFLAVVILAKCLLTLLLGHPKEKTYGYIIDTVDDERYALNMWETSIGRNNSCDIVIGYDTVSRFQAVISRRIDGWYIYDLLSKSGIMVNGEKCDKKAMIKGGDLLTFGNANFRFAVIDDPVMKVGKKTKGKKSLPRGTKALRASQGRPIRPGQGAPQGGIEFSQRNKENNSAGFNPSALGGFYDSTNKPTLHFEKKSVNPDFISESTKDKNVYSGKDITPSYIGEAFVQTPERGSVPSGGSFTVSRPVLINMDTKEKYILQGNLVSIGRSKGCDIVLSSPSVSRKHANLVLYEDGWAVENTSSTVGTYLNKTKISSAQLLFDKDVISLGDERLYYSSGRRPM